MAFTLTPIAAKDGAGSTIGGGLLAADVAGSGVGPFFLFHGLVDGVAGVNKANITVGNALKVDGSAVTQPVSLTSTTITGTVAVTQSGTWSLSANQSVNAAQINGVTPLMGNGVTGTGSQRVTIASDNTAFSVNATLQASATTAIGKVDPNTPANWALGAFAAAMPANGQGIGLFDGTNMVRAKGDETSGIWVNIKAGAGSGGTALADAAAFTESTTSFTPIGGVFKTSHTALTSGQAGAVALTAAREMLGLGKIWDGTNTATVKAASTAPVTATDSAVVTVLRPDSAGVITTGTAGSPSAQVISNQGVVGGTPIPNLPALTAAANGLAKSRVNAANSTNATSLKASAGNIGSISLFNVAAYTVFLKLYNKASAPTVGTDTPARTIPIAAGGGYEREFTRGNSFATGIAYAITKLQADSDTTVVAAGDVTGEIEWI